MMVLMFINGLMMVERTSHQWKISDDGGYRILNVNVNKVLDMDGNSMNDGGNAIIWPDNGGLNQRWLIENAGNGYFNIINYNSGKALEVDKSSSALKEQMSFKGL